MALGHQGKKVLRIAANGLGRTGNLPLRQLFGEARGGEVAALNGPFAELRQHALLPELDTVHDRWGHGIEARDGHLSVDGLAMRLTQVKVFRDLPLRALGVEPALDCTGVHRSAANLRICVDVGIQNVSIDASEVQGRPEPCPRHQSRPLRSRVHDIATAASRTTSRLVPFVNVMYDYSYITRC